MKMLRHPLVTALFALLVAACATAPPQEKAAAPAPAPAKAKPVIADAPENGRLGAIAATDKPFAKDRLAILGMAGDYQVTFKFEETVVLSRDYERKVTAPTGGFETVVVVEDSDKHIVLQHLLVSEDDGSVTKHWRQDWTYEAPTRFEFSEDQTWRIRPVPAALRKGTWTQCVYEVNDAPRYCGTGKWSYRDGLAAWASDATWRPLPRREYSTRSDYNALLVKNRHSLTPTGWTHEQDNTKVVRKGEVVDRQLVREFGFNDYRRIVGFDFTPALNYWKATGPYWARVRAQWKKRMAAGQGIHLKTPVNGMPMIEPLLTQADSVQTGNIVDDSAIVAVFDHWTEAPSKAKPVVATKGAAADPAKAPKAEVLE